MGIRMVGCLGGWIDGGWLGGEGRDGCLDAWMLGWREVEDQVMWWW